MDRLTPKEMIQAIKSNYPDASRYSMLCEALIHAIELLQAESEGRLIVLPCKVGDTVWGKYRNNLTPFTVKRIDDPLIHLSNDDEPISLQCWFPADEWGIRVFASCEEAEAALGGDGDGCGMGN